MKVVDLRITKDLGYLAVSSPILEHPHPFSFGTSGERGHNMLLGDVPAHSRGTTFDPVRTAAKHRPASRKFRLDESAVDQVDEERRLRFFTEIYRNRMHERRRVS